MKIYYVLLVFVCVSLFSSCGKAPAKELPSKKSNPSMTESRSSEESDESSAAKLVDADEFSKIFSNTVHQPEVKSEELQVDDGRKFFKSGAFVQNKFDNQEFIESTPPSSSLASDVVNSTKYSWLPNWSFSGKGGVRLPDAVISQDKSLIAVLDNVSSQGKAVSTLLVLINAYNFNINGIFYFSGKFLSQVKFIPSTTKVVVWEKSQKDLNSGSLHIIDLKTGKISLSSQPISASSANFAITKNGEKLILKPGSKKSKLYLFELKSFDQMPTPIECNQKEGLTVISPDDSQFALIGKNEIEVFKFSDNMKLKEIPINLKSLPNAALCIENNIFAMLSYQNPLNLVVDNSLKQLSPLAGRKLFFRDDVKAIVFEEYKNKAVSIIDLKSLKKLDSFSPEKLKPKTKGDALLLSYLPQHKKYLLFDGQGNMSLFYRPGRRWRKTLIFSQKQ